MIKTRILVDAHVFDGEFQGSRTFIKEIYLVIAQQEEMEIFFVANDVERLKQEFQLIQDNENVHFTPFKSKNKFKRLLFELPSLIKKYKIDYAHFQYVIPPLISCKYIVTIHDVLFLDFPNEFSFAYRLSKKFLFKYAAKKSHIITTVSDYSRQAIAKHFKIEESRIVITPNGVSDRYFSHLPKESSKDFINQSYNIGAYLLYISRFESRKNHYAALKVYLELALYDKGYHLVLLGHKSSNVQEFDALLQKQNQEIQTKIFISSEIDNDDLIHFYNGADLFLYPSRAEGFGIPPLEAGAMKTPVVCSNATAMKDYTFFGVNHINTDDYELFRKTVENNLSNERCHSNLNTISETIRDKYTWEHSAHTLISTIKSDFK